MDTPCDLLPIKYIGGLPDTVFSWYLEIILILIVHLKVHRDRQENVDFDRLQSHQLSRRTL